MESNSQQRMYMHGGQAKICAGVSKLGKICGCKGINDLSIHKV